VCDIKKPVKTTNQFDAQLAILDHKNIICAGYTAVIHIHTGIEEITLSVSRQSEIMHNFASGVH
jgi:peptide chain release factor subunit 3